MEPRCPSPQSRQGKATNQWADSMRPVGTLQFQVRGVNPRFAVPGLGEGPLITRISRIKTGNRSDVSPPASGGFRAGSSDSAQLRPTGLVTPGFAWMRAIGGPAKRHEGHGERTLFRGWTAKLLARFFCPSVVSAEAVVRRTPWPWSPGGEAGDKNGFQTVGMLQLAIGANPLKTDSLP